MKEKKEIYRKFNINIIHPKERPKKDKKQRLRWTKEEIDTLKKYGEKETAKELHKRIPNRSVDTIGSKRTEMGIKHHYKHTYICKPFMIDGYMGIMINGKPKRMHRIIMEKHIGRKLKPEEIIHHIDGDKLNNDIVNLHICNNGDHARVHASFSHLLKSLYSDGIISFDSDKGIYLYNF